jgi:arylsulfatase A-like enzyme
LGAYGYERSTSPRLDELAREAVVFETATAVSSFTHPTHMTMLTGLPPSIHGVSRWRKPDSSVAYLPEILSRAGYRTNGIVSGPLLSQSFGFERGLHVYHAFHDETRAPDLAKSALEMLRRGRGQPQFLFLHFFDAHWPYWPGDGLNTLFGPLCDTSGLLHKVRTTPCRAKPGPRAFPRT